MLSKLVSKLKAEKKKDNENTISSNQNQFKDSSSQKFDQSTNLDITLDKFLENTLYDSLKFSLHQFKLNNIDTVYYIPNYITEQDEKYFLDKIYNQPKDRWTYLAHAKRRLQKWGGNVTKNGLENQELLPDWLEKLSNKLVSQNITTKKTNHVLLNEYEPGSGIMPHTDGPLYHPYVVILSMKSHTTFKFYKDYNAYKEDDYLCNLLVEPRSLLIFCDKVYHEYLHCIEDKKEDVIDAILEKNMEQNIDVITSSITNLSSTSIYTNLQGSSSSLQIGQRTEYSKRLIRDTRISLTIRYVPEMHIENNNN